jgi:hypothetical protein
MHRRYNMNSETRERTLSHKQQIINLLKDAGSKGVTNSDLSKIGYRYNARIQEMYVEGYEIKVEELAGGLTKYILISEPESKKSKPNKALDILVEDIKSKYNNSITCDDLLEYLKEQNFTVRRNVGSFC